MNDELNILDELAYAVQHTLGHYRELLRDGRYTDARECLAMTEELTNQVRAIEDHVTPEVVRTYAFIPTTTRSEVSDAA